MFVDRRVLFLSLAFVVVAVAYSAPQLVSADEKTKPPHHFALLVGVDEYVYVHGLQFCVADQKRSPSSSSPPATPKTRCTCSTTRLRRSNFCPFKSNVETQLKLVLDLAEKGDTVLIGFSGHGVHVDGHSYLLPSDAKLEDPQGTMVSLDKVYDELMACKASLKFLIVDACRNDPHVDWQARSSTPRAACRSSPNRWKNRPKEFRSWPVALPASSRGKMPTWDMACSFISSWKACKAKPPTRMAWFRSCGWPTIPAARQKNTWPANSSPPKRPTFVAKSADPWNWRHRSQPAEFGSEDRAVHGSHHAILKTRRRTTGAVRPGIRRRLQASDCRLR